ncbi:MAG: hypothetical protein K0Q85_45 [Caproiciproducens sp.]|jgi:hypothetical protein|nr:hypothetical protein [Caproiciproducens sp.]
MKRNKCNALCPLILRGGRFSIYWSFTKQNVCSKMAIQTHVLKGVVIWLKHL